MEFNFDLRLLDRLVLRKPILPRNEERDLVLSTERSDESDQRVTFERAEDAIQYCRQKLEEGWGVQRPEEARQSRLEHPALKKEALFTRDGRPLAKVLTTGQRQLDRNLGLVRLDR